MNFLTRSFCRSYVASLIPTSSAKQFAVLPQIHNAESTPKQSQEDADKLYSIVELELKGNDPAVLRSFCKFAVTAGRHLDVESKSWSLRKPLHERYTVLKSVHIYKKHMVQYEFRTYFNFVQYQRLTGSTADTLLEYVERNLPEGVALKATKVELQKIPQHISAPVNEETTKI